MPNILVLESLFNFEQSRADSEPTADPNYTGARLRDPGWPDRGSQESKNPLLSSACPAGMEDTCPICKRRLDAHADGQMAECGLELMQKDYGWSYTEDFVWMCPGCDGKIDDHDDTMLARCSRLLVLGDYSGGVCAG